jgi:hypothetical protein
MSMYLRGNVTGLSAREAKERAARNMPAVARPQDRADWQIFYLSKTQVQPGQAEFQLTEEEKGTLA